MDKMETLFTGNECWVRFATGITTGTAKLQPNNNVGLKDGEKIAIDFYGRIRLFKVEIDNFPLETENEKRLGAKIALLSNQVGDADFVSMCWKGSSAKFLARQVFGTNKAKWSLGTTAVTIIGAGGAAINSAQTATCSGLHCVSPFSRVLLGVSAVAVLLGWVKDNLS
ncbi:MAG: hypothetical protein DMG31_18210 [Acidobacteria bacterium]|nr:MAG: hypothetical protein DMG31_18210 [Acidobacteriota bacterium]